jgi:hypothetical protein
LAYAIGRHRPHLWPLFLSMPFLLAIRLSQWSPYLTAAMLVPSLTVVSLAKPNLGLAVFARLEGRALLTAGAICAGGRNPQSLTRSPLAS